MIEAPRLVGWISLPDAADLLGVSSQAVHKMTRDKGPLVGCVRRIELPEHEATRADRRTLLVLEEAMVRRLKAQRDAQTAQPEELLAAN